MAKQHIQNDTHIDTHDIDTHNENGIREDNRKKHIKYKDINI
jgi:hypothetical protein